MIGRWVGCLFWKICCKNQSFMCVAKPLKQPWWRIRNWFRICPILFIHGWDADTLLPPFVPLVAVCNPKCHSIGGIWPHDIKDGLCDVIDDILQTCISICLCNFVAWFLIKRVRRTPVCATSNIITKGLWPKEWLSSSWQEIGIHSSRFWYSRNELFVDAADGGNSLPLAALLQSTLM